MIESFRMRLSKELGSAYRITKFEASGNGVVGIVQPEPPQYRDGKAFCAAFGASDLSIEAAAMYAKSLKSAIEAERG